MPPLPDELLQAISTPAGGRLALVLGAGCSVEAPTGIPVSRIVSLEIHRRLIDDGVLAEGDCANPEDLSCVADEVFAKRNSQRDVVERFLDRYDLKLATANEGYRIAAAMLLEGALSSIVTLNFDLGLSAALSEIGAGTTIGVIESPEDLPRQRAINIYYLHRNANAHPELWVLRTVALEVEWRTQWEPIIATRVLTAPVVVFAGLGTPVAVLIESTRLIRDSLPGTRSLYQVDPTPPAQSQFFQRSGLDLAHYIQLGWGEFMRQLADRLVAEHIHQLEQAIELQIRVEQLPDEDIGELSSQLRNLGLLDLGFLRANWLLHDKPYLRASEDAIRLFGDLLQAVAMMGRVSDSLPIVLVNGLVEFRREGRTIAVFILASGRGYRSSSAVEADISYRLARYHIGLNTLSALVVGGTTNPTRVTPPTSVALGNVSSDDLIGGTGFPTYHITDLRSDPASVREILE